MSWDLVKACTVPISNIDGDIKGTGFLISPEGYLLTCAHVIEETGGWERVQVIQNMEVLIIFSSVI